MSVQSPTAADYLEITTGLFSTASDYSFCGWAQINVVALAFGAFLGRGDATNLSFELGLDSADGRRVVWYTGVGNHNGSPLTILDLNRWAHVALTRVASSNLHTMIINGRQTSSVVDTPYVITGTDTLRMFKDSNAEWSQSSLAGWKLWTAALTLQEIQAEIGYPYPKRIANLWAYWPLTSPTDITDHSGNGHDWTAFGTLSTDIEPPYRVAFSGPGRVIGQRRFDRAALTRGSLVSAPEYVAADAFYFGSGGVAQYRAQFDGQFSRVFGRVN